MYQKIINKLNDKKIAIIGFGKEGKSTFKFIRKYVNAQVTIIDKNDNLLIDNPELKEYDDLNFVIGPNYLENLNIYDVLIKTPGVKIPDDYPEEIINKVTSQMELILEVLSENIIGITGTKGKSTTSTLLYNVLKDQGKDCFLLGNIGFPILDYIEEFKKDSILVIEMSSNQLELVDCSPHIGIILNLYEEHLNFHGTKEKYFNSKLNVFRYQNENDYSLYTSANENLRNLVTEEYKGQKIDIHNEFCINDNYIYYKNEPIYNINDERYLQGEHNLYNIMFVLKVAKILDLDLDRVINSINSFKPLEHRMEYVGCYNGKRYYNDVIATVPEATISCLNTIKDVDTLIFGGLDRGINYDMFIEYLNNSTIENFICMPDSGYKIADKLKRENVYKIETLEEAVELAKRITKKVCVLSPAASSYNAFKNFQEKGKRYKELLKLD